MASCERGAADQTAVEELRQWKRALGWWSGLPEQEAFDLWKNRRRPSDEAVPDDRT